MSSTARSVVGAIKTALALPNGAGSYTFDLTGDDRVLMYSPRGGAMRTPPVVYITGVAMTSAHGDALGYFRRAVRVSVVGFASVTSDNLGEATLRAADLLSDLLRGIETDRSLGALVYDVTTEGSALAEEDAGTVVARCDLTITAHWQQRTGV